MLTLIHFTTGDRRTISTSHCTRNLRRDLEPLLRARKGRYPGEKGLHFEFVAAPRGGALFSIGVEGVKDFVSTNVVAWDRATAPIMWKLIEDSWRTFGSRFPSLEPIVQSRSFTMPSACPWLATIRWPNDAVSDGLIDHLSEAELCIAETAIG